MMPVNLGGGGNNSLLHNVGEKKLHQPLVICLASLFYWIL